MAAETSRGLQHLLYILEKVGHTEIRMNKTMQDPRSGRANERSLSSKPASHHTQTQKEIGVLSLTWAAKWGRV